MILNPRWRKMVRDLWGNKTSTILVTLSIAIGVFAIGVIAGAHAILSDGMDQSYQAVNPASARLYTTNAFDENLIESIRNMNEVQDAAGRYVLTVRVQVGENEWRNLQLFALPDYDDISIHKVQPDQGAWPPSKRELLIERDTFDWMGVNINENLLIETPSGEERTLRVTGVAHEMSLFPSKLAGTAYGYITFETLEWLGISYSFNQILLIPENKFDLDYSQSVINLVKDKLEENAVDLQSIYIPTSPDKHNAQHIIESMTYVLYFLGCFILFLSCLLVINTISGLLIQQINQIGIMKTIGARTDQLISMYLGLPLVFGFSAIMIAMPSAEFGAYALSDLLLDVVNFTVSNFEIPQYVYMIQIGIGLIIPIIAAISPVIFGTRLTIKEALYTDRRNQVGKGTKVVERLLLLIPPTILINLPRPLLLSLRNTFRQTGRMILTLATLTLGSAIFIAVFSVRASTILTFEEISQYWQYDVEVTLQDTHRLEGIQSAATQVPGVIDAVGWGLYNSRRVRADGSESTNLILLAPPAETKQLKPILIAGRWLHPHDENAIVIDLDLLKHEPDLKIGSELVTKAEGREVSWQIVGIVKGQHKGFPVAYANYSYFSREVVREVGRANRIVIVAEQHDPMYQSQIASAIDKNFKQAGLKTNLTETVHEIRSRVERQFNIVIAFLIIMAILISVVGGFGLVGTMTLNILERTREIGIMRAIGASNAALQRIIIFEGLLIGLLSWFLGAILAWPLSKFLSNALGKALIQCPLSYTFPISGIFIWLIVMILLSTLATLLPAWSASRLSVKETLKYG